jgi:hypothetical protein
MNTRNALSLLVVLCTLPVRGGVGTTTGREWGRWTEDQYSVIVAKIREVARTGEDPCMYRAVFEPLATLAGRFDPSAQSAWEVRFYAGADTSNRKPPQSGATVIAVIQPVPLDDGRNHPQRLFVVSDYCGFIPGESSILEVDGLADPRIAEVVKKIREARARPDPNPYGSATRRSTTAP